SIRRRQISKDVSSNDCISISVKEKPSQDYTLIYSLSHMRWLRFITRLKLYQTGIITSFSIYSFGIYTNRIPIDYTIDNNDLIGCMLCGFTSFLILHWMSREIRKIVGRIYWNEKENVLDFHHLSYLTGKRLSTKIPLDHLTTGKHHDHDLFTVICHENNKDIQFYISRRFGKLVKENKFNEIFKRIV
ncbi:hypothetical protein SNEBB_010004, partial [Seison nebaliae]